MSEVNIPPERYDLRILNSLRRVVRAIDIHSRKLSNDYKITVPQLLCLQAIEVEKNTTISNITKKVYLSPGTIVGIIDRLEEKELIIRERDKKDRRKVNISITEKGKELTKNAPSPLQDKLMIALKNISEKEQTIIAQSLEHIVRLMEADNIDASPILESGDIKP